MNKVIKTIDIDRYLQILDIGIEQELTNGEVLAMIKDELEPKEPEAVL